MSVDHQISPSDHNPSAHPAPEKPRDPASRKPEAAEPAESAEDSVLLAGDSGVPRLLEAPRTLLRLPAPDAREIREIPAPPPTEVDEAKRAVNRELPSSEAESAKVAYTEVPHPKACASAPLPDAEHSLAEASPSANSAACSRGSASLGKLLGALGGLSLAASLLCFAAAHWLGWSPTARIAFFAGFAVAAFLPLVFYAGPNPAVRDISTASGGLLLGLLLTAIGQTWQTGEGAAALMLAWAGLLLPWALLVRRPLIFTLWFAVALGAAVLQGDQMAESFRLLERLFPAAMLSLLSSLALSSFGMRSESSALRAAGILPAAAAAVLLGILPGAELGIQVFEAPALFIWIYLAGALIFAAAAFLSKRPELRALALLAVLSWVNGAVLRLAKAAQFASDEGLLYILTLLNGLAFLGWIFWRGKQRADRQASDAGGPSFLDWICRRIPQAAGALIGAAAALLLAATIFTALSLNGTEAGGILFAVGAGTEISRRLKMRGQQSFLAASASSSLGIIAFTLAAAGWIVLLGSLSGESAAGILIGLALLAALFFRSRIALAAAFLAGAAAPDLQQAWLGWVPAASAAAAALFAAALAFAPRKSLIEREALWCLPALLVVQWLAPILFGLSLPAERIMHPEAAQSAGAAALLLAGLAGCLADKKTAARRTVATACALLAGYAFSASASLLLCLAAAFASALKKKLSPALLSLILLLVLLECGRVYWQSPENGVNLLLEGARMQGIAGLALILSAVALSLVPGVAAALRPALRIRALPILLLFLTGAAVFSSIALRTEIAEAGKVYAAELIPSDPRDIVMGDFMALAYAADGREALEAYRGRVPQSAAAEAPADPAAFCAASEGGVLTILSAVGRDEACPKESALRLPADRSAAWRMTPKLPHRWFFPSGEAERFSAARYAELRCLRDRCLITGLLDENQRRILPVLSNSDISKAP